MCMSTSMSRSRSMSLSSSLRLTSRFGLSLSGSLCPDLCDSASVCV